MTPGMPGTGIGGMFYLLSAIVLPLRESYRRVRDGLAAASWRVIVLQQLLAGGILAGMWVTGLLLGTVLGASRHSMVAGAGTHSGNLLRTATFAISIATLVLVLGAVELAGIWLRHRDRRSAGQERSIQPSTIERAPRRLAAGRARVLMLLAAVEVVSAFGSPKATAQANASGTTALAVADSTFAAGDAAAAVRAYAAVLAIDPENSRAIYRLADLLKSTPARALPLFRRYVALEPDDPWGYLAVADMLARLGRSDEALRWSADALRLAPEERDAVIGRARVLSRTRHTDAAVTAYRDWLREHGKDAEAWQELSRELVRAGRPGEAVRALERAQAVSHDLSIGRRLAILRAAAAPAMTPIVGGSRDSDGNTTWRVGGQVDLAANGPVRFGVALHRERVGDGVSGGGTALGALALQAAWQPRAVLKFDVAAGAVRVGRIGGASPSPTVIPTGLLRARWRAPGDGPRVEIRAGRRLLDASPLLVANRVVRGEVGASLSVPVTGPLTLRGIGNAARLSDSLEVNYKTALTGVVALAVTPAVELSGQFHQIHYDRPSAAGYFAPWLAQIVEAGSYIEIETPASFVLAVDAGVGVQRISRQRARFGPWRPAIRLYALLDAPLAPGRDLRLELESEDSQVAEQASLTSGEWRYGSVTASLRWALP